MVLCSYQRLPRNSDGASDLSPPKRSVHSSAEGQPNIRDTELHQMTKQIQAVMEKVDALNRRMSTIEPQSPPPTVRQSVTCDQALQELPDFPTSGENETHPTLLEGGKQSIPPNVMIEPEAISPEYHGPTSSEFSFEVANQSLMELGVGSSIGVHNPSAKLNSLPSILRKTTADKTLLQSVLAQDPLWMVARQDALRYIDTYHNTLGALYPVINSSCLAPKVLLLFEALDSARISRYRSGFGNLIELLVSNDTKIIKLLIAIGIFTELGVLGTEGATKFVQSVIDSSDDSLMDVEGLGGVQILVGIVSPRLSCSKLRKC